MTNSTSEREQRLKDDRAIHEIISEWCGEGTIGVMRQKIVEHITTIRQEERRAVWDAAIMLIKDRFGGAANIRVVDVVGTLQDAYAEAAANETREDAGDAS